MTKEIERNFGPQPIIELMEVEALTPNDLVRSSTETITHKMVSRACKGRRLSPNVRLKVLRALNAAAGKEFGMAELFNYQKPKPPQAE